MKIESIGVVVLVLSACAANGTAPGSSGGSSTADAAAPVTPGSSTASPLAALAAAPAQSIVGLAGKCLDVDGGATADGSVVQLYACNGSVAQQWAYVGGQLIGPGGKCLDVVDQNDADGARVQLWTCSNGANQQWTFQDGQIVGLGGRCLDVAGNSVADRTPIRIWSCSGQPNQWFSADGAMPSFYGGNAHWDYSWTSQQIADHMHQVGMTTLRMDTGGYDAGQVARVAAHASALSAINPKLHVFAAVTGDFDATKDEATNYADAFAGAKAAAMVLGAAGVTDFECGNERPSDPRVFPDQTAAGDVRSQYAAGAPWAALRGTFRGMIDGVKSVSSSYRTAVNFTIAQIAASDMLWEGSAPDGSTGGPTVRWDITSWHNYEIYGSLFGMGTQGHGTDFNLVAYVAKAYGRPIMITEWNSNPEDSDATKMAFSAAWLADAYAYRARYRIESTMIYQLDGGPADFGLFAFPGQTATVASFASAHLAL